MGNLLGKSKKIIVFFMRVFKCTCIVLSFLSNVWNWILNGILSTPDFLFCIENKYYISLTSLKIDSVKRMSG